MTMPTHVEPTAVVDPRAELDDEVRIGPFCVIGPKARIGRGTHLINSVTVMGRVTIGQHNRIFPGAVLGGDPQDISYLGRGASTWWPSSATIFRPKRFGRWPRPIACFIGRKSVWNMPASYCDRTICSCRRRTTC